jgi:divalent metal cation (Fe/Co/Zn/Cd) transporter
MENTEQNKNIVPRLYAIALAWAIFGIVYNLCEGIISTWFGVQEETLTLLGFGIDSFIETISAVGIAHMVLRIRRAPDSPRDRFESLALRITGTCFYALTITLILGSAISSWRGDTPQTTIPGVIISSISLLIMWIMLRAKLYLGHALDSAAMIADANCTRVCIYMSVVLLLSSLLFETTHIGYFDALGAVALAWLSYREGKEAFEKASGKEACCAHHGH